MNEQDLEEEVDTLEYALDNLDSLVSLFKSLSSKEYELIISQAQELLNEIDYVLIDKQQKLDSFTEQQLLESRLERYEREMEYRIMQGF